MVTLRRQAAAIGDPPISDDIVLNQAPKTPSKKKSSSASVETAPSVDGWKGDGSGAGIRGNTLFQKFLSHVAILGLMVLTPPFAILMWYLHCVHHGDHEKVITHFYNNGIFQGLYDIWPSPTLISLKIIGCFALLEALLQLFMPGKKWIGPVTATGFQPVYKANGFQCYLATGIIFVVSWRTGHFDPALVYDNFGSILSSMNIIAFLLCIFLLIKGHLAPSGADSGSCGSVLYDFYWGMELYPRIGSFDIKEFTNCRFGMMAWEFLILCFLVKQQQMNDGVVADSMIVSVFLMTVYNTKFFMWETGYWGSIDIMHDRAGYYICWGCLVWVPSIYTSPALYLVNNPVALGTPLAAAITFAGLFCIWSNYDCDRQRQTFRETEGKAPVWGKPPTYIVAKYTTSEGTKKSSLLLTSGWWGLARHFHYLPEIMSSFFWTMPGLFTHPLHYFYVFYLTILLADRAIRDDSRCLSKYGAFWQEYQSKVPYRILPYFF